MPTTNPPDTETSSSNSALPVILDVPPIEVLPATSSVLPNDTAPAIVACPPILISPDKDTSLLNVAAPTTEAVPPIIALSTDILPVIGIPVIFVPSP